MAGASVTPLRTEPTDRVVAVTAKAKATSSFVLVLGAMRGASALLCSSQKKSGKMDLSPPLRSLTTLAAAGEEGTQQVANAERRAEGGGIYAPLPRSFAPQVGY